MTFYFWFIIFLVKISLQIELTYFLEIFSDNSDPIVFMRYSGENVFISTRTKSLIFNFDVETQGHFDSDVTLFSNYIVSSFIPQVQSTTSSYFFAYINNI